VVLDLCILKIHKIFKNYILNKNIMDMEKLNEELKNQNYSYIIQTLYNSDPNNAYEWALKKCDDGHVPLWYFLVRSYHLSTFDNNRYDTIRQAFKMALKSLILAMIHISCCNEINKSFEIVNILSYKYDEKFSGYLTVQIFEECIKEVYDYFDEKFKNDIKNIDNTNPISDFPDPYWVYNCIKGGWRQSAIQCHYNPNELDYIKKKFISNYSESCEKRFLAYEQSKEKISIILEYFKKNNCLELEKGFNTIELVRELNNNDNVDNCFLQ
jgi:hypothetical protein